MAVQGRTAYDLDATQLEILRDARRNVKLICIICMQPMRNSKKSKLYRDFPKECQPHLHMMDQHPDQCH